jgi:anti-sigma regulatory factor (Ser/Thr protein kinase)
VIIAVHEASQVGQARRTASELARSAGMNETGVSRIAIVATEAASNLVKHAGGGVVTIAPFDDGEGRGIELMAFDRGPGIADIGRSMADGFSTAGTPGGGLGAIARQSDRWAIFSRPGLGTAVMARFVIDAAPAHPPRGAVVGAVIAPHPLEQICGDGWRFADTGDGPTFLMADGSGHGEHALRATTVAAETFEVHSGDECVRLVERIHKALAPTRGAAVAVARIDVGEQLVRYVGVGNIAGALISDGEMRRMVSHNGTAGHVAARIREFTYPFTGKPLVVLHSDGLSAKWGLASYPGLAANHPSLIAGVLFRDHRREKDDSSVLVARLA